MYTISACESNPSTNLPYWNKFRRSGVFALNTYHIKANVAQSKIELMGPMKSINRLMLLIPPAVQVCETEQNDAAIKMNFQTAR